MKLFSEIKGPDLIKFKGMTTVPFTDVELSLIKDKVLKSLRPSNIPGRPKGISLDKDSYILYVGSETQAHKYDDEWYVVDTSTLSNRYLTTYFKCDQIDGLIECLLYLS